jgi:replicative DNA helicase
MQNTDEIPEEAEMPVEPMHIGKALKTAFKMIKEGHDKDFGYGNNDSRRTIHTFTSLAPYWLARGTVNCLMAEPGLSLSLFLRLMLECNSLSSDAVLLVSKQPTEELITMLAASISRIDYSRIRDKRISTLDLPCLSQIASELYGSDCYLYEDAKLSPGNLNNIIQNRSDTSEPFGLVLLNDYLSSPQIGEQLDDDIFNELRTIAEKHNLSIIVAKAASPRELYQPDFVPDNRTRFDLTMILRFAEGCNFELSASHVSGFTATSNLVRNPANGVFEAWG